MEAKLREYFWALPNAISLVRLIFGAPVTIIFYRNGYEYAWLIFLGFAALDWLDGFLARRLNAGSSLGMKLDPLADQFLVLPIIWYFWLASIPVVNGSALILYIPAFLTVRETLMLFLRFLASKNIPSILSGKRKTVVEYAGVSLILFGGSVTRFGVVALILAMFLAGWSFIRYLQIVVRVGNADNRA